MYIRLEMCFVTARCVCFSKRVHNAHNSECKLLPQTRCPRVGAEQRFETEAPVGETLHARISCVCVRKTRKGHVTFTTHVQYTEYTRSCCG